MNVMYDELIKKRQRAENTITKVLQRLEKDVKEAGLTMVSVDLNMLVKYIDGKYSIDSTKIRIEI